MSQHIRTTLTTTLVIVAAACVPLVVRDDWLGLLAAGFVLAIGAAGLNVQLGYTGQVSLAHAFFVAIGAYTAAVLAGDPEGPTVGLGLASPLLWVPASAVTAGAVGYVLAPLVARLDGLYLAVATLGIVVVGEWAVTQATVVSGGPLVGREAPAPLLLGSDLTRSARFSEEQMLYWLTLVVLVVVLLAVARLVRSDIGRALVAVRDREGAAATLGVSVGRHKQVAFTVAATAAGLSGSLMFVAAGYFSPERFGLAMTVQAIAAVLVGGAGTLAGPVIGALVIAGLPRVAAELHRAAPLAPTSPLEHPNVYDVEVLLYGLLLLVVVLFQPQGLAGLLRRRGARSS